MITCLGEQSSVGASWGLRVERAARATGGGGGHFLLEAPARYPAWGPREVGDRTPPSHGAVACYLDCVRLTNLAGPGFLCEPQGLLSGGRGRTARPDGQPGRWADSWPCSPPHGGLAGMCGWEKSFQLFCVIMGPGVAGDRPICLRLVSGGGALEDDRGHSGVSFRAQPTSLEPL